VARLLTVHVGLEKTGTTFLQHGLSALRPTMRQQGIEYPGRAHAQHGPVRDLLGIRSRLCDDSLLAGAAAGTWAELHDELTAHRGDAIISCEYLSWATADEARHVLEQLPADHVRIVVTARALRRTLPSLWQEQVRHGETRCPHDWLDQAVRPAVDGAASTDRLFRADPVSVIRRWTEAGADDLAIVPTDGAGQDFFPHFLEACGLPPGTEGAFTEVDRPRHASDDPIRTELMRRVVSGAPRSRDCAFLAAVLRPALRLGTRPLPHDPDPPALCADHGEWARSRDTALATLGLPGQVGGLAGDRVPDDQDGTRAGRWCRGDYEGGPLGAERFERIAGRCVAAARVAAWMWATGRAVPGVDRALRTGLRRRRYRVTGAPHA
jgi:hypothetical protein